MGGGSTTSGAADYKMKDLITLLILFAMFSFISASGGDRSPIYQQCVRNCVKEHCSTDGTSFKNGSTLHQQQDIWCRLLWNCPDECGYHCMWTTVKVFHERGYGTPKFYGKWPFTRLLGAQEPASAFSSYLNLFAHVYMSYKIQSEFPVRTVPVVLLWHVFSAICINAWAWSIIFHTRDKPFSEFMDYACALSMVMSLYFAAVIRVFHKRRKFAAICLGVPLFYFVTHVRYLYTGNIDYDYNMKVNVLFGVLGSMIWLVWATAQYASGRRAARRMVTFVVASGAALALELLDFPPWRDAWDAHALWHLATAPLPLLFYGFVIDDLRYIQSGQYEKLL